MKRLRNKGVSYGAIGEWLFEKYRYSLDARDIRRILLGLEHKKKEKGAHKPPFSDLGLHLFLLPVGQIVRSEVLPCHDDSVLCFPILDFACPVGSDYNDVSILFNEENSQNLPITIHLGTRMS